MGVDAALALASLRFGLSRFTTIEEVDYAAGRVTEAVRWLRGLG
jgi:cysteine desulfurase